MNLCNKKRVFKEVVNSRDEEISDIQKCYDAFWSKTKKDLAHYFRYLYSLFIFIKNSDVNNKKMYSNIVRAQLSNQELALLFYHCLSAHGKEILYPTVVDYELMDDLPYDMLFNQYHIKLYDKKAFGNNKEILKAYDLLDDLE